MRALGRLLRLSLAPSALADIAAGTVLCAGEWPGGPGPFLLMAGSACVYHGGLALNDWADADEDARTRPERPLPSGAVAPATALVLAVILLGLGPVLAWLAAPQAGACLAVVAVLAVLYDLGGRGAWAGPLLLGSCRAGNLAAGLLLGSLARESSAAPGWLVLAPFLYGSYVLALSRIARLEDRSAAEVAAAEPGRWLVLTAVLLPLHAAPGWIAFAWGARSGDLSLPGAAAAVLLAGWGALGMLRARPSRAPWTAADCGRAAGMGLRRLLVATAALAAQGESGAGLLVAGSILCGYPLSYALRRLFPPT